MWLNRDKREDRSRFRKNGKMNIWIVQSCKLPYLFLPLDQYKPYVGECLKVHVTDLQKRMTRRQSQSGRTRWFNEAIYHVFSMMRELLFSWQEHGWETQNWGKIAHEQRFIIQGNWCPARANLYIIVGFLYGLCLYFLLYAGKTVQKPLEKTCFQKAFLPI